MCPLCCKIASIKHSGSNDEAVESRQAAEAVSVLVALAPLPEDISYGDIRRDYS